jgi:hypothetical protein
MIEKQLFDVELVRSYPRSNKKITMQVHPYRLLHEKNPPEEGHTLYISPHGIEFHSPQEYPEGMLLKIHLELPDYWKRKKQFVEYNRIDVPDSLKMLVRVIKTDSATKGKKKTVLVQTVNMEEIDETVLKLFLDEKKS